MQEVRNGEKVIIQTDNAGLIFRILTLFLIEPQQTYIRKVDGDWIPETLFTDDELALSPGVHNFEFSCEQRGEDREEVRVENRLINLEVGIRYVVTCSLYGGFTVKRYLEPPEQEENKATESTKPRHSYSQHRDRM
ncbi:hypothetical protein [Bacterioplanoides sp.]|uniref:hypothetical protein n=1 Tax=Bacterioplanoides sp. TaxID=2066072 RepID=UPI003B5CD969